MYRIRNLFFVLGVVVLTVTAPAVANAQPPATRTAAAPMDLHDCDDDWFCVWEDAGTAGPGGHFAMFQKGSPDLREKIGNFVFQDRISYVWNRTTQIWCLSDDIHYEGALLRISVEWQGPLEPRYKFNDRVSSLQPCDRS